MSEPEPEPEPNIYNPEPEPEPESEPEPEPEPINTIDLDNFNTGITTFNDISNLINVFINNTEIFNNITVKNSATLNIISDKSYDDISNQPTRIMNSAQTVDFVTANTKINSNFRSFFELLSEKPGSFVDLSIVITTSNIDISWSLDHLYPTNINNLSLNIPGIPYKTLPIINDIYIDISYTFTNGTNVYTNLFTITGDNVYKDTNLRSKYITSPIQQITKIYVLNKLTQQYSQQSYLLEDNSFSIFVYGDNNSDGSVNKLEYKNIVFEKAKAPLIVNLHQHEIINRNQIRFTLDIHEEESNPETTFSLTHIDISYSLIEDKSNLNFSDNQVKTFTNSQFYISNNRYIFTLTDVYYGSKYNVEFKAKNNGNNNYSNFGAFNTLNFTELPNVSIGTNIISTIHRTPTRKNLRNKYYTNNNYDSNRIYYHGNRVLNLSNNNQQFSLSKENSNINQNSGYGLYIENSNNLLDISLLYYSDKDNINYDKFYNVKFDGWKVHDINYITTFSILPTSNVSTSDYFNNNIDKGFFKKANIQFNTIQYNDLSSNNKLQKIEYNVNSHFNTDYEKGDINDQYFVVDTLAQSPQYEITDFSVINITYVYNSGVSSVQDFNIILSIKITNLNSDLEWLPQNIGNIIINNNINQINNNFNIQNNDISSSGIYNFTYNNLTHFTNENTNFDNSGHQFIVSGTIHNLYQSITINNNYYNPQLYCDYLSFYETANNGKITTSRCPRFYQLSNININTDIFSTDQTYTIHINDFSTNLYDDHTLFPNYPSLVYKKGKFTNDGDLSRNIFISKLDSDINRTNTQYMNHLKNIRNNLINSNLNIETQLIYFYKEINGVTRLFVGNLDSTFNGNNLWYGNYVSDDGLKFNTDNVSIRIRGARESSNKIKIQRSWAYLSQEFSINVQAEDVYFLIKVS